MKKRHLLGLLFASCAFAQEPTTPANPEIAKIDARLKELTEIWREDTGVINRLTNFKRTPVQQGSRAYYQCLESSKRIQQAEAEAKTLKEKRISLESNGESISGRNIPESGSDAGEIVTPNDLFSISEIAIPAIPYEKRIHGPKVKDLFVGMSMSEFAEKSQAMMGEPYRQIVSKKDEAPFLTLIPHHTSPPLSPVAKGSFVVVPKDVNLGIVQKEVIFGFAGSDGKINSFYIPSKASKAIFKAGALHLEEFVKNFENGYKVDLAANIRVLPMTYEGLTQEGIKIVIYSDFSVLMAAATKPEETKNAFD